jgi:hypothetical protein
MDQNENQQNNPTEELTFEDQGLLQTENVPKLNKLLDEFYTIL